ncbi:MAG: hypothetical protein ACRDRK_08720 [Pseudonocardia sp.]
MLTALIIGADVGTRDTAGTGASAVRVARDGRYLVLFSRSRA